MNRSLALVLAVAASCAALTGSCSLNPQPFPPSTTFGGSAGSGAQGANQDAASPLDAGGSNAVRAADASQDAVPADAPSEASSDAANEPDSSADGALDVATEQSE